MLLWLFLAMLPLKLITGKGSTSLAFQTSDKQLRLLSVAGDCVFECGKYPPCQMIKVRKNGKGCALDDETEEQNHDVFSYVKKIVTNPVDVPLVAAPNGAWSEWALWTTCSRNIANGTTTRKRTCANGPACNGETTESHPCPKYGGSAEKRDLALAACGGSFVVIDPDDWSGTIPPGMDTWGLYWVSLPPGNTLCSADENPTMSFTNGGDISSAITICRPITWSQIRLCL